MLQFYKLTLPSWSSFPTQSPTIAPPYLLKYTPQGYPYLYVWFLFILVSIVTGITMTRGDERDYHIWLWDIRNFSSPTKVFSTKNQVFTFGHPKGKIPLGGVNGPPSGGVGPLDGGSGPLKNGGPSKGMFVHYNPQEGHHIGHFVIEAWCSLEHQF
jgi:hypothetical protein